MCDCIGKPRRDAEGRLCTHEPNPPELAEIIRRKREEIQPIWDATARTAEPPTYDVSPGAFIEVGPPDADNVSSDHLFGCDQAHQTGPCRCRCGRPVEESFDKCEWHKARAEKSDNVPSEECSCAMTEGSMRSCAVHGEESTEEILSAWEASQRADNVPSDRVHAYAEVLRWTRWMTEHTRARACAALEDHQMAVAHREQATLLAEIAGLRAMAERRAALQAVDDERVNRLYDQMRDRAEKAEAEIARLRAENSRLVIDVVAAGLKDAEALARVEALAAAWETPPVRINSIRSEVIAHHLREALRGPEPTEDGA